MTRRRYVLGERERVKPQTASEQRVADLDREAEVRCPRCLLFGQHECIGRVDDYVRRLDYDPTVV